MIDTEYDSEKINNLPAISNQNTIQETQNVTVKTSKFCSECGAEISAKAAICPKCGAPVKGAAVTVTRNPGTAAILSFFWTGLGQIYNGEISKGILLTIVQAVNVLLMFVIVGFITFPIVWVYGIWDAHKRAQEINTQ
ncbi:MAG TPA: zinc-ribbon domain-containing protein [Methanothrix sp.]|nr:zinc-ribbon domain-containing protein [Methanothrix sp.]